MQEVTVTQFCTWCLSDTLPYRCYWFDILFGLGCNQFDDIVHLNNVEYLINELKEVHRQHCELEITRLDHIHFQTEKVLCYCVNCVYVYAPYVLMMNIPLCITELCSWYYPGLWMFVVDNTFGCKIEINLRLSLSLCWYIIHLNEML